MKHTTTRRIRTFGLVLTGLGGILPAAARADSVDLLKTLHPYVELGVGYDSNVFRVEDAAQAGGLIDGSGLGDSFLDIEAGLNGKLNHKRQVFRLHGRVYRNQYDRFDEADFTGGDAKVSWDWAVGKAWTGDLGYEFRRGLRDYSTQSVPSKDLTSTNVISGSAGRQLSNRWRLSVGGNVADTEFSREERLDLRRTSSGMSLAYGTLKDNTLSLDTNYSKRQSEGSADLGYSELLVGPSMEWHTSDRSRVHMTIQYTKRDENNTALRDYTGVTGRLDGILTTSLSSSLDVSLWRQLSSLGDEIANFAVVNGVSVDPTFRIGRRTSLGLGISYEVRDFRGDPELIGPPGQGLSSRDDKVLSGRLLLEWRFTDNSRLSLEYGGQNRESNRIARDYDAHRVQVNFRVGL